ncbi:MAG: hypothetical protein Q9190_003579 [Brigantiaea leucoxantha]
MPLFWSLWKAGPNKRTAIIWPNQNAREGFKQDAIVEPKGKNLKENPLTAIQRQQNLAYWLYTTRNAQKHKSKVHLVQTTTANDESVAFPVDTKSQKKVYSVEDDLCSGDEHASGWTYGRAKLSLGDDESSFESSNSLNPVPQLSANASLHPKSEAKLTLDRKNGIDRSSWVSHKDETIPVREISLLDIVAEKINQQYSHHIICSDEDDSGDTASRTSQDQRGDGTINSPLSGTTVSPSTSVSSHGPSGSPIPSETYCTEKVKNCVLTPAISRKAPVIQVPQAEEPTNLTVENARSEKLLNSRETSYESEINELKEDHTKQIQNLENEAFKLENTYKEKLEKLSAAKIEESRRRETEIEKLKKARDYHKHRAYSCYKNVNLELQSAKEGQKHAVLRGQAFQQQAEQERERRISAVEKAKFETAQKDSELQDLKLENRRLILTGERLLKENGLLTTRNGADRKEAEAPPNFLAFEIYRELDPEFLESTLERPELLMELQKLQSLYRISLDNLAKLGSEKEVLHDRILGWYKDHDENPEEVAVIHNLLEYKDKMYADLEKRTAELGAAYDELDANKTQEVAQAAARLEASEMQQERLRQENKFLEERLQLVSDRQNDIVTMLRKKLRLSEVVQMINGELAAVKQDNVILSAELSKKGKRNDNLLKQLRHWQVSAIRRNQISADNNKRMEDLEEKDRLREDRLVEARIMKEQEEVSHNQTIKETSEKILGLKDEKSQLKTYNEKLKREKPDAVRDWFVELTTQDLEKERHEKKLLEREIKHLQEQQKHIETGTHKTDLDFLKNKCDALYDDSETRREHVCRLQEENRILRASVDYPTYMNFRRLYEDMQGQAIAWATLNHELERLKRKAEADRQIAAFEKRRMISAGQEMWKMLQDQQLLLEEAKLMGPAEIECFENFQKRNSEWMHTLARQSPSGYNLKTQDSTQTQTQPIAIEDTAEYLAARNATQNFLSFADDERDVEREVPPAAAAADEEEEEDVERNPPEHVRHMLNVAQCVYHDVVEPEPTVPTSPPTAYAPIIEQEVQPSNDQLAAHIFESQLSISSLAVHYAESIETGVPTANPPDPNISNHHYHPPETQPPSNPWLMFPLPPPPPAPPGLGFSHDRPLPSPPNRFSSPLHPEFPPTPNATPRPQARRMPGFFDIPSARDGRYVGFGGKGKEKGKEKRRGGWGAVVQG